MFVARKPRERGQTTAAGVRAAVVAAVAFCAAWSPGCTPGIDPSLITRYQQSLQQHPKGRAEGGPAGVDLLRPVDGTEPLKVVDDPVTGAKAAEITLDQAVRMAMRNSMDIRVVSFDPGISRAEIERAAGAFDLVVFGGVNHTLTDHRTSRVETSLPGSAVAAGGAGAFPPSAGFSNSRTTEYQAGLREHMVTGGDVELSWDLTRTRDNSLLYIPNPRYDSRLALTLTQPLLRGAGVEYNLATLRIAAINTRAAYAQFRQQVEEIVTQVQTGYWQLVLARRQLLIAQELLDKTIETRDRVRKRYEMDATQVEIKQTESAVETRRALRVRARKVVFDAQDQLARLVSDPKVNLLGAYAIVPATPPVTNSVTVDPTDQLVQALKSSPVLEQARLNISAAAIRVTVAKNELLPRLDLTASAGVQGLDGKPSSAGEDMGDFNFIDYSIGAALEYPLANRTARATLRQKTLERLKTVADLQNAADKVALDVNQVVREIRTSYEEMLAQQAAREASALELQALEDTERIRGRLTPEFLQVKLQSQVGLAGAEDAEIRAIVSFNNALARLAQVTGTTLQQHNIQLAAEAAIEHRYGEQVAWPDTTAGPAPPIGSGNISTVTTRPATESAPAATGD